MDEKDYAKKLVGFTPVEKSFTNDEGQKIEYTVFEVTVMTAGNPYTFDVKTKNIADKIALLDLADDQE